MWQHKRSNRSDGSQGTGGASHRSASPFTSRSAINKAVREAVTAVLTEHGRDSFVERLKSEVRQELRKEIRASLLNCHPIAERRPPAGVQTRQLRPNQFCSSPGFGTAIVSSSPAGTLNPSAFTTPDSAAQPVARFDSEDEHEWLSRHLRVAGVELVHDSSVTKSKERKPRMTREGSLVSVSASTPAAALRRRLAAQGLAETGQESQATSAHGKSAGKSGVVKKKTLERGPDILPPGHVEKCKSDPITSKGAERWRMGVKKIQCIQALAGEPQVEVVVAEDQGQEDEAESEEEPEEGLSESEYEEGEDEEHRSRAPTACAKLQRLVHSVYFDAFIASLLVLNAIFIGVEVDLEARRTSIDYTDPLWLEVVGRLFFVAFALELLLRLGVDGLRDFFCGPSWRWNALDAGMLTLQVVEVLEVVSMNLTVVRVVRIVRLLRIMRIIRILRIVSELRTLIASIISSFKLLGWTMVLFVTVLYVLGVCLTQLVNLSDARDDQDLQSYYGNLGTSMMILFECITGGIDWHEAMDPLVTHISPAMAYIFPLYITFGVLALMNVVTGVFVESSLLSAKNDKDYFMINNVRELFTRTDQSQEGVITWEAFMDQLDTPLMKNYFKALDLDLSEARGLFRLLDMDNSGTVDAEEFLHGCMRFRGGAKALDLALMMRELRQMNRRVRQLGQRVPGYLSEVHVQQLPKVVQTYDALPPPPPDPAVGLGVQQLPSAIGAQPSMQAAKTMAKSRTWSRACMAGSVASMVDEDCELEQHRLSSAFSKNMVSGEPCPTAARGRGFASEQPSPGSPGALSPVSTEIEKRTTQTPRQISSSSAQGEQTRTGGLRAALTSILPQIVNGTGGTSNSLPTHEHAAAGEQTRTGGSLPSLKSNAGNASNALSQGSLPSLTQDNAAPKRTRRSGTLGSQSSQEAIDRGGDRSTTPSPAPSQSLAPVGSGARSIPPDLHCDLD